MFFPQSKNPAKIDLAVGEKRVYLCLSSSICCFICIVICKWLIPSRIVCIFGTSRETILRRIVCIINGMINCFACWKSSFTFANISDFPFECFSSELFQTECNYCSYFLCKFVLVISFVWWRSVRIRSSKFLRGFWGKLHMLVKYKIKHIPRINILVVLKYKINKELFKINSIFRSYYFIILN